MDTHIWQTLFISVLFALLRSSSSKTLDKPRLPEDHVVGKYNILVFVQNWTPTSCYLFNKNSSINQCEIREDDDWKINGIWPLAFDKYGPTYCSNSSNFDFKNIEQRYPEIKMKWKSVLKGVQPHDFWKTEWLRHGTCSVDLEEISTEAQYIRKGLNLFNAYNMKNVLTKAGLQLNHSYNVQTYLDEVKKILGKKPFLKCVRDSDKKRQYLWQMVTCFDKKFQLIDCHDIVQLRGDCNLKEEIYYPASVPYYAEPRRL